MHVCDCQSATQLYTYEVFVWRALLMLTTNSFDYSKFSNADKSWLETYTVAVFVGGGGARLRGGCSQQEQPKAEAAACRRQQ